MAGGKNSINVNNSAVQVLLGVVMVGVGAYLFYTERRRDANRRDWLVALGVLLMAVGALYTFGLFFGSILLVDEMLDWFK